MNVLGHFISEEQIAAIGGAIVEPFNLADATKAAELAGVPKGLVAREVARLIAKSKLPGFLLKIIDNTESAHKAFLSEAEALWAGGCGSSSISLSEADLKALQQGRCVAFDDGEFSTFIMLSSPDQNPGSSS